MIGALGIALAVIAGSCIGSYSATAALRLARQEQSVAGRSACDSCGVQLGFARTIPLLSYAQVGGVCRDCGGRIDPLHLAGEALGAVLLASAFIVAPPERAALLSVIGVALLTASVVDIRTQRLPDFLTAVVAVAGLTLSALQGWDAVLVGVASAVAIFGLLEAVRWSFSRLRKTAGLGFGDVKLLAALALWLGTAMPWVLALAAAAGLVVALIRPPKDGRVAFGPFIAGAAWLVGIVLELTP